MVGLTPWRAFVAVCDEGSVSAAAEPLGYSQSAVSRQVAALEAELGVGLLERLPRGARPTAAGTALLPHARAVVGEIARGSAAARAAEGGLATVLTLGAVPSATAGLVPRALRLLRERLPDHGCTLRTGLSVELQERVLAGELDAAVVTDYPPGLPHERGLARIHLLEDEVCVAVPAEHRLARGRSRVRLERFAEEVWAEDIPGSERVLVRAAAAAGFEPRIELEAGDLLGKLALVSSGAAVALVPALLGPALPPAVRIRRLVDPPTRGVYAIRRTTPRHETDVLTLVELLQAAAESG
jgi:DNA-binding transcriptional LysR family regulator